MSTEHKILEDLYVDERSCKFEFILDDARSHTVEDLIAAAAALLNVASYHLSDGEFDALVHKHLKQPGICPPWTI